MAGFVLVFVVDYLESRCIERMLTLEQLAVTARIQALEMRRQEKNFFLRHDPEALAAVRGHQKAAVSAIETIRTLDPDHDPLCDAALAQLGAYLAGFMAMAGSPDIPDEADPVALYLERSQSLEQLAAVHPALAPAINRLMRLEKHWLASGTPDDLKRLRREGARLGETARQESTPPGEADRVLADYLTALAAYAGRVEQAGSTEAAFVAAARALEPVTEDLRTRYETKRHDITRSADLIVAALQLTILLLVALAAWGLFRSVAGPLAELGRHARRVARGEDGNLDPAAFSGEFQELATDLARMESHLRTTINTLADKEREARLARQRAETLSRVKSDFLGLVSHEFKTPLTSMVGFAQVMRKRLERGVFAKAARNDYELAAEAARYSHNLAIMLEEGRHLTGLIDNVLELAALESGDLPLALAPVSIADIVDRAAMPHLGAMTLKGLAFARDIPGNFPLVRCDRDRMVFVLGQLLSNAVKFTRSGHIACRVRREADMAVVTVEDTGQGIPAAMHEVVFEKFRQLGDATTGKMPGLGIGLAASRAVVEHHGGVIRIAGQPGHGVAVTFTLPLAGAGA
nr:HAMP domain-containing sensor histidine kinase [Solidesulfovibrio aerotolerans]